MNNYKLFIHLVLIFLITSSCKTSSKEVQKGVGKADFEAFYTNNTKLDQSYIESGCLATNSLKNQIADIFSYTDFFHIYLQFKSYHPNLLNRFSCSQNLDQHVISLFALDREPLEKIDFSSNIESYAIHREIIRNLHKIIDVNKSPNSNYTLIAGIKSGKLFNSSQKEQINQLTNPKTNLKFYSYFDEKTGHYHEFFIPIKNFNLIKSYLLALNQNSKENFKGGVIVS